MFKHQTCEKQIDNEGADSGNSSSAIPKTTNKGAQAEPKSAIKLIPTDTLKSKLLSRADIASINEPLPILKPGTYYEEPEVA